MYEKWIVTVSPPSHTMTSDEVVSPHQFFLAFFNVSPSDVLYTGQLARPKRGRRAIPWALGSDMGLIECVSMSATYFLGLACAHLQGMDGLEESGLLSKESGDQKKSPFLFGPLPQLLLTRSPG